MENNTVQQTSIQRESVGITPGEWMPGVYETTPTMLERLKRPQSCVCVATPGPETGMVVALCGDAHDARSQADANLIAAAPDLKLSLIDILDELEDRYDGAPDSPSLWMASHIQTIRESLRKAGAK